MAKYIVEPAGKFVIIKCFKCKTMYVPEPQRPDKWGCFENCPFCGYSNNDSGQRISLWAYNLIRYIRSMRRKDMDEK